MINDSDDIIVSGLLKIRDGILADDIEIICEGYTIITGEEIQPPKKSKPRLQSIREKLAQEKESPVKVKKQKTTKKPKESAKKKSTPTLDEIKADLVNAGVPQELIDSKDDAGVVELAKKYLVETDAIIEKKQGSLTVVTGEFDPEVAEQNLSRRKPRKSRPRGEPVLEKLEKTKNSDSDVRCSGTPSIKPPWR